MTFIIQASNPHALLTRDDSTTLSDAVESVFPLHTEHAILRWNHIHIPLGYKYDMSLLIDDVLHIVAALSNAPIGSRAVHWPSSTFSSVWNMTWDQGIINIQTTWDSVIGDTEALLTSRSELHVPIEDFIVEWKRPLQLIERALSSAGYDEDLPGLGLLRATLKDITGEGQLYRW